MNAEKKVSFLFEGWGGKGGEMNEGAFEEWKRMRLANVLSML